MGSSHAKQPEATGGPGVWSAPREALLMPCRRGRLAGLESGARFARLLYDAVLSLYVDLLEKANAQLSAPCVLSE